MAADDEVKAAGRERELLGVGLLKPDRVAAFRRLAPRLGEHRGREVDAGNVMTAGRELEGEEAGAGARRTTKVSRDSGRGVLLAGKARATLAGATPASAAPRGASTPTVRPARGALPPRRGRQPRGGPERAGSIAGAPSGR